ncbi:helix-turn-helix domain-containing protein [Pseudomonas sp. JL3]|uniref:helix-turn-helix domain-containing protein n=1 Tax=Pseudomonas sp. JL3 TaxID=2919943 RepID=UPI00285649A7|nr:helix-turn-helix domain-containing protein [Pseudomonas sp. JL3]MDR8365043.1 helix-turn-helix domain-containing protein [Pseudomonas sp. JL3]
MSLRTAYAATLQFLRAHKKLSQQKIAKQINQSQISRLEAAERSVSLEVSEQLAESFQLDPLSLLTVVYAAHRGQSPREILRRLHDDLDSSNLLDVSVSNELDKTAHPVTAKATKLKSDIFELMDEGHSQAEVARRLGVSRQTVSKHVREREND